MTACPHDGPGVGDGCGNSGAIANRAPMPTAPAPTVPAGATGRSGGSATAARSAATPCVTVAPAGATKLIVGAACAGKGGNILTAIEIVETACRAADRMLAAGQIGTAREHLRRALVHLHPLISRTNSSASQVPATRPASRSPTIPAAGTK